ncbi:uncharacterized protein C20orf85 [Nematostella vectensis]|uniref:uncharacterized protein C20orf85 n=1 Tax=Nematostella vectensis TaxID=45351 RepID=UPI00138FFDA4|nr:uncharacterized protein C20orf85 [Nematostella vectensis]
MSGGGGKIKTCNFVHKDEIWKDHVKMELFAQRRWPDKWGFLAQEYEQLQQRTLHIGDKKDDATEAVTKTTSEAKPEVTSMTYPKTNSQIIGWRLQYEADHPKPAIRRAGKKDIVKQLRWPREGI